MRPLLVALALLALLPASAAADEGEHRFRRTTPRATLEDEGGALVLGVPGGRAWGIESRLRPLPPSGSALVRLAVDDDAVREAFVRIAYYARAAGRPRQIAIADSDVVVPGGDRLVVLTLDPPPAAVAFRLRVLARLRMGVDASRSDAITARIARPEARLFGSLLSRLLPDPP